MCICWLKTADQSSRRIHHLSLQSDEFLPVCAGRAVFLYIQHMLSVPAPLNPPPASHLLLEWPRSSDGVWDSPKSSGLLSVRTYLRRFHSFLTRTNLVWKFEANFTGGHTLGHITISRNVMLSGINVFVLMRDSLSASQRGVSHCETGSSQQYLKPFYSITVFFSDGRKSFCDNRTFTVWHLQQEEFLWEHQEKHDL